MNNIQFLKNSKIGKAYKIGENLGKLDKKVKYFGIWK